MILFPLIRLVSASKIVNYHNKRSFCAIYSSFDLILFSSVLRVQKYTSVLIATASVVFRLVRIVTRVSFNSSTTGRITVRFDVGNIY